MPYLISSKSKIKIVQQADDVWTAIMDFCGDDFKPSAYTKWRTGYLQEILADEDIQVRDVGEEHMIQDFIPEHVRGALESNEVRYHDREGRRFLKKYEIEISDDSKGAIAISASKNKALEEWERETYDKLSEKFGPKEKSPVQEKSEEDPKAALVTAAMKRFRARTTS